MGAVRVKEQYDGVIAALRARMVGLYEAKQVDDVAAYVALLEDKVELLSYAVTHWKQVAKGNELRAEGYKGLVREYGDKADM